MTKYFYAAIAFSLALSPALAQDIVDRAESTELRRSKGQVVPRVARNADGDVTHLLLNEMTLTSEDFAELARLEHLRALVLYRTNVTDEDLPHLKGCKALDHLNLTSTEVTDAAIDTLLELEQLKSLCLGNVNITSQAIEKLKERNRTSDQRLRWGYYQRKR